MKSMTDAGSGQILDLGHLVNMLDRFYPRLLTQIDRDPDSPTYGSCDRHFWMYRLNDFDSGVVQQASLALAALDQLADHTDFTGCSNLDPAHRPYWRDLALAINRRNLYLLGRNGFLDEYFPGERSFPATVFAGYATLKSAVMLGQDEIISSPELARTATLLLDRAPSAAANQDTACAAFLTLYAKARDWNKGRAAEAAERLLAGQDGRGAFLEYGGLDLGYATVSLNYLACMVEDQAHPAAQAMDRLARVIADFVTPRGRLGGEFAARSTTYFLPFGLVVAALRGGDPDGRFRLLDLTSAFDKLDDRYLMHYCLPSLAMAALKVARDGKALPLPPSAAGTWVTGDHADAGLYVCRSAKASVFIGLNKGGVVQAETPSSTVIDCGYRVRRSDRVYATCVIDAAPDVRVEQSEGGLRAVITVPFQRYATLVASPLKTMVLRFLGFLGPAFNTYFKSRLIKSTQVLPGVELKRRISVTFPDQAVTIEDEIIGLAPGDALHRAPPWSFRLVPSAKFYQDGEADPSAADTAILTERAFTKTIALDG